MLYSLEEGGRRPALAIALLFVSGKGFESEGEYMYVSCVLSVLV